MRIPPTANNTVSRLFQPIHIQEIAMNTIVKTQFGNALSAFVIGITFLGVALASQPVLVDDALSAKVQFGDLNLNSAAGAKILYGRLSKAARSVCSPFESRELATTAKWHNCYDRALAAAVAKIDKPMVTQLHDSSAHPWQKVAAVDGPTTGRALANN
jgi:UrcA family protein